MSAPGTMRILRTRAELRAWRRSLPTSATVGFVPTMGALHAGHLSLVGLSRADCTVTAASIFVNPLQFGPKEDLARYPRPFERDCELLEKAGVQALFAPSTEEMYRADASTYVVEEKVSGPLCGEFRPGHFRGVATVVLKLFNLVQPDVAYFGQKDAQQCAVIERMVRDLEVPVRIVRGPTIREADGLAMSSRNQYLSPAERSRATDLWKSLSRVRDLWRSGESDASKLRSEGLAVLESSGEFRVQYLEIRDRESMELIPRVPETGALVAVAAYLGNTRLIDNLMLEK